MTHVVLLAVYMLILGPVLLCLLRPGVPIGPLATRMIWTGAVFGIAAAAMAPGIYFTHHRYLHDVWVVMDAANREMHGLRSSIDYPNPLGPLFGWILGLATSLRGLSLALLPMANALVALAAAGIAILMLRRCTTPLSLAIVVLITVAAAITPRESQSTFAELEASFLAPYNRWGWALLVPVTLRLLVPLDRPDPTGSIVLGVAIAGLMLLKISYGAAALGLLLISGVLRPGGWRDLAAGGTSLLATLVLVELLTGQVSANLADLAAISNLPLSGLRLGRLPRLFGEAAIYACAALLLLQLGRGPETTHGLGKLCAGLLIVACTGMGMGILMQNHDYTGAAIYPLLPLTAAEWAGLTRTPALRQTAKPGNETKHRAHSVLGALFLLFVLHGPLTGIGLATAQHLWLTITPPTKERAVAVQGFEDTPLAGLHIRGDLLPGPQACASKSCQELRSAQEGLALLRQAGAAAPGAGPALVMNFSNPFPVLLDARSPRNIPLWMDWGRSIGPETLPPPEIFFEDVEFLLGDVRDPRWPDGYAAYVDIHFEVLAEGAHTGLLWRRTGPRTSHNEDPSQ